MAATVDREALRAWLDGLAPHQLAEVDRILAGYDPPPVSFREFVDQVRPGYQWYRHCEILAERLEAVESGELSRLMVFEPPRHGKSEECSRLFPAYYLRRHPDHWVGLTSYSAELAYTLSRSARNFYRGTSDLSQEARAVKHWETGKGGGMWAAGVGGSQTGKGMHLGVCDDPLKDAQDAQSDLIKQGQKDWWDSTFYTRLEPGGRLILIMTRWNMDDLAGYLLSKEAVEAEGWHVLDLPALKHSEPLMVTVAGDIRDIPDTITVEEDWRAEGEALCPERYDADRLAKIRSLLGEYFFGALFQQRPRPREGGMFQRSRFEILGPDVVGALPPATHVVRYWDKAASDGSGDWTVGVKMWLFDGRPLVVDVVRGQWDTAPRDRIIRQTAEADGPMVRQRSEQEGGASGKDAARHFVRMLEGFSASATRVSGDKVLRAEPLASAAGVQPIGLYRANWNLQFIEELCAFPMGKYDDQVDAASGAYNSLMQRRAGKTIPIEVGDFLKESIYDRIG